MIPDTSSSWLPARVGVLTGSVFGKAIAKTKDGKWAASLKPYSDEPDRDSNGLKKGAR